MWSFLPQIHWAFSGLHNFQIFHENAQELSDGLGIDFVLINCNIMYMYFSDIHRSLLIFAQIVYYFVCHVTEAKI